MSKFGFGLPFNWPKAIVRGNASNNSGGVDGASAPLASRVGGASGGAGSVGATSSRPAASLSNGRDVALRPEMIVRRAPVETAICEAIAGLACAAVVARPDTRAIMAVSQAFELMTGYDSEVFVGNTARLLGYGCENDLRHLARRRASCATGAPSTVVLTGRRRSGEQFMSVLHTFGLTVATELESGAEVWYILGLQEDVTERSSVYVESRLACLEDCAADVMAAVGVRLATVSNFAHLHSYGEGADAVQLLSRPRRRDSIVFPDVF
eukprot:TRINITY_DN73986_c0_g1_i1.p1 TRINITY_DN73986_c0_g1~~TRINITY_DN73986_c0_g1_i1.p1  ORF type:complete len:267 (-),score=43.07 TRINITY_DN73986_c0_g1_i1:105-905(-)